MDLALYASIAVIAAQLIAGKAVTSLYECSLPDTVEVEVESLPNATLISTFHELFRDYLPGYATGGSYQYAIDSSGKTLEMTFKGTSFICRILGSSSYFIGNVRGSIIYIFDHTASSAVNFRISGCRKDERDNESTVCHTDLPGTHGMFS